jgi:uncharacterized RDD family membrane protein YckC
MGHPGLTSACFRCGLPLQGAVDCPQCLGGPPLSERETPRLLARDLKLDRRKRDSGRGEPVPLPAPSPNAHAMTPVPPVARRAEVPVHRATLRYGQRALVAESDVPLQWVDEEEELVFQLLATPRAGTPTAPVVAVLPSNVLTADDLLPAALPRPTRDIPARPAPPWKRMAAFLLDAVLVAGAGALMMYAASRVAGLQLRSLHAASAVVRPALALFAVLGTLYATAFALLWSGRTLGCRAWGLHLVDGTGQPPSGARAGARLLLSLLSALPLGAGLLLSLWDAEGQAFHDRLTQTWLVELVPPPRAVHARR